MKNILIHHFLEIFHQYISHPCFSELTSNPQHPYCRPLAKTGMKDIDLNTPINVKEIYSQKNQIINIVLFTIYEQDLLFLPPNFKAEQTYSDFTSFYEPSFVALGKFIKPILETLAFQFLTDEIEIVGNWHKNDLINYLKQRIEKENSEPSTLCEALLHAADPAEAAKMYLIQLAPDFLSEASAMARTLPGSFGEEQSEIMKVFIDEYGYGVHQTKHSTLFEKTLKSVNLSPLIHYYYHDYLTSSLMLVNFYHFICSNKAAWFRYLGTIYYTEATIPHLNKQLIPALKKCLPEIDTEYFEEHIHIDKYHQDMILKIIAFSIDKYGEGIIDDILFGFEAGKLLQQLADKEIIQRINMMNDVNTQKPNEMR